MMDKNLIIASVLSVAFLMAWFRFFPPASAPRTASKAESVSRNESASDPTLPGAAAEVWKQEKGATPQETPLERVLDFGGGKMVLTSRGAAMLHWWVKENEKVESNGKNRADLVNHPAPTQLLPFESLPLATYPNLNFKELRTRKLSETGTESVWRATLPNGISIEKKYVVGEDYFLNLSLSLKNPGKSPQTVTGFYVGWTHGLGTVESEQKENNQMSRVLAYPSPTKEVDVFKKTGDQRTDYRWVAVDNRYYLTAIFPKSGHFDHISTKKGKKDPPEAILTTDAFVLAPGEQRVFELKIYGGPKGYVQLKNLGLGLEHAVDFGTFGFLGKWALKAMNRLHGWTGNYGWAIILLTCVLQTLVFPLSLKSYRSTAAMKKLQPKIQDLQKRYKEDPKRLNQEMMLLYKQSGTNPFGGCLPMVLQIPVFWAFFTMLRNSYELRGTPWIFWIQDLSQKDPYYVLPIIMGGGMLLQQKISGSAGADPTQAKIMMFMPVMFTVMFLNFPSGLVLYWLTNSILTIVSQAWFSKKMA
ncbi:MAG: membrane protein insertase YidC [Elusimicrobia bacterium]|nr:membrane protein insertase YidC [Elusimicrobiota bacterium]